MTCFGRRRKQNLLNQLRMPACPWSDTRGSSRLAVPEVEPLEKRKWTKGKSKCQNCGSTVHSDKECVERPKQTNAKRAAIAKKKQADKLADKLFAQDGGDGDGSLFGSSLMADFSRARKKQKVGKGEREAEASGETDEAEAAVDKAGGGEGKEEEEEGEGKEGLKKETREKGREGKEQGKERQKKDKREREDTAEKEGEEEGEGSEDR
eukprot:g36721.t1